MQCPDCGQAELLPVSLPLPTTVGARRDTTIHVAHVWRCPACETGIISDEELQLAISAVSVESQKTGTA